MGSTNGVRQRCRVRILALTLLATACSTTWAQQPDSLKAGFVLNFLKFTEWPNLPKTATNTPITLAVIATPELAGIFTAALDGKTLHGRRLEARAIPPEIAATNTSLACHALYISSAAISAWPGIRKNLAERPILTISDAPRFCEAGGMLNLYEKDNRFRFSANQEAANPTGLKLRSELLKLATIVKSERDTP